MLALGRRGLCLLAAACLPALAAAGDAQAHGDPATHFLEGDVLYPAVASRPSQERELALIGLLRAAGQRGYPIKVALIATSADLALDPTMLRAPQRYAAFVAGQLQRAHPLRAPLLVVTPYGFGVAGPVPRDVSFAGLRVPARPTATRSPSRRRRPCGASPGRAATRCRLTSPPPDSSTRLLPGTTGAGAEPLLAWIAYELLVTGRHDGDGEPLDGHGSRVVGSHLSKRLDHLERSER